MHHRHPRISTRSGFTLIELMIVVAIIGILAVIAIPNFVAMQLRSRRSELPTNIESIRSAQSTFRATDADHDQQPDFAASLVELRTAGLISASLGAGSDSGYAYSVVAGGQGSEWAMAGSPEGLDGGRCFFFADGDGVVRAGSTGPLTTANSFVLTPSVLSAGTQGILPLRTCEGQLCDDGHTAACEALVTECIANRKTACLDVADLGIPLALPPPSGFPRALTPESAGDFGLPFFSAEDADRFDLDLFDAGVEAVHNLDARLEPDAGALAMAASLLGVQSKVEAILDALDTDSSGDLDLSELFYGDLLALARSLVPALVGSDPGPSIGADGDLQAVVSSYLSGLAASLGLDPMEPGADASLAQMTRLAEPGELLTELNGPLTPAQQACVNALHKDLTGVAMSVAKAAEKCVGAAAKGMLDEVAACPASDGQGKIAKARAKVDADFAELCSGSDDEGRSRVAHVFARRVDAHSLVAAALETRHLGVVLGPDPDAAVSGATGPTLLCQAAVTKSVGKCSRALLSGFGACAASGLAVGKEPFPDGAHSAAQLETCLGADPKGSIAKACDLGTSGDKKVDGIRRALAVKCEAADVDLVAAFPGCAIAGAEAAHDCIAAGVRCLACNAVNAVDDFALDCDGFDNSADDSSCAEF